MYKQICKPLPICSKCIQHEINSWINENIQNLNITLVQKIREEMKRVKLNPGECIVCHENKTADVAEKVVNILDEKVDKEKVEEFKRYFCY